MFSADLLSPVSETPLPESPGRSRFDEETFNFPSLNERVDFETFISLP
jgi:hypothetical protein